MPKPRGLITRNIAICVFCVAELFDACRTSACPRKQVAQLPVDGDDKTNAGRPRPCDRFHEGWIENSHGGCGR